MTARQLVLDTLEGKNTKGRVPRQLWVLPWAGRHYPEELAQIQRDYPDDIITAPACLTQPTFGKGDPYEVGTSTDDWGCRFENREYGIVGEVKVPLVDGDDLEWEDVSQVHIPIEWLSSDWEKVNEFCEQNKDRFILAGCCPRPFEQLQFIRGTENLMMDMHEPPPNMLKFLRKMHAFYCELLEKWAKTDVDALNFMDDWGSQQSMLIHPDTWVEVFKPLYRDYIQIAHSHGKKIFMHSDGNTLAIIPHLIELGLDALNTQLFCIGVDKLAPYVGQITFWGEIDRQYILPHGTRQEVDQAVELVGSTLWKNGGAIAQCEFGIGAKPENVRQVFESWSRFGGL